MKHLPALLLLAACSAPPAAAAWEPREVLPPPLVPPGGVYAYPVGGYAPATLRLVSSGRYESADARFQVVWNPDGDMWMVYPAGNTEPVCEAAWGKGYR